MKASVLILSFAVAGIFFLTSCEKNDPDPEPRQPDVLELTEKSAKVLDGGQQFSFELFRKVNALSGKENMMISSLSVSYALGMTYNGSAGTTRDAFRDVLHYGDLDDQGVNESYKDLMGQLLHLDEQVEFSIANSIWYRQGFTVLEDFISTNREYFDAAVEELNLYRGKQFEPTLVDMFVDALDEYVHANKFANRSQAIRHLVNKNTVEQKWQCNNYVAGSVTLIYDPHRKEIQNQIL